MQKSDYDHHKEGVYMSDSEKKFIAFICVVLGFLVLPIIATILKLDTRHIPKIVILLSWFISANIISAIWFYIRGNR